MKKYVKLTGFEVPTPEAEMRAAKFLKWFGAVSEDLTRELGEGFDHDVYIDTALQVHTAIALKGLIITGKYRHYYLRAYRNGILAARKQDGKTVELTIDVEEVPHDEPVGFAALRGEVLEYVRDNYPALDASLFEIYIELGVSYAGLSEAFGISLNRISYRLTKIRADVAETFKNKANSLYK